jgi:hypothetical protein
MRKLGWLIVCGVALCGPAMAEGLAKMAEGPAKVAAVPAKNRPIKNQYGAVTAYARRFDNAYITARHGKKFRPIEAPYDDAAAAPAQDMHEAAVAKCMAAQSQYATNHDWAECFLAADSNFADAVGLRDTLLTDSFATTIRRAAADADSGKLNADQLGSVYLVVRSAYARIVEDEYSTWRKTHPAAP